MAENTTPPRRGDTGATGINPDRNTQDYSPADSQSQEKSSEDRTPQMARMPWYPRDFRSKTLTWPLVAKAVYRELLDCQWDSGGLPDDERQLRTIVNATAAEWKTAWPYVAPKFPKWADGLLRNERLEQHREDALGKHEHATKAAQARWRQGGSHGR